MEYAAYGQRKEKKLLAFGQESAGFAQRKRPPAGKKEIMSPAAKSSD